MHVSFVFVLLLYDWWLAFVKLVVLSYLRCFGCVCLRFVVLFDWLTGLSAWIVVLLWVFGFVFACCYLGFVDFGLFWFDGLSCWLIWLVYDWWLIRCVCVWACWFWITIPVVLWFTSCLWFLTLCFCYLVYCFGLGCLYFALGFLFVWLR